MKKWLILVAILAVISQACEIKVNEKDKDDDTDTITINEKARGPAGLDLKPKRDADSEFPGDNYGDGPKLDDTRASLRAIQEADIVQIVADRLYAISKASGLAIIDVSVQDTMSLLGRFRTDATPFEMYVRGDHVIGLFKEVPDEGSASGTASRILTLNVADPSAVVVQDTFDLPGTIVDSRIVDSILFVASHEQDETPTTTVVSLNVSDFNSITEVNRLSFDEVATSWNDPNWSKKSISISDDRLYISGPVNEENSTIQVIDISDTSGNMVMGTTVQVSGSIFSRWQIDEYNNVLRVISQPPDSSYIDPPVVQTFRINTSNSIDPLGSLTLTLPRQELLRSVRFDDDKAYAITFERTDPLFIIDLIDPANPVQAGELETPGFVFHLEPRGDRLLGLGFEPGNSEGGLHVSLFDVSDMQNPSQLARVNFGPTWSSIGSFYDSDVGVLGEDRNRLHKLFKVMDDLGLIMVPFSGWSGEEIGCGRFDSGVQLVDFTADTLTKRGAVGATGTARRAFIHNERMFTFSENQIQSFNINDRDEPVRTAQMPLSLRVHRTMPVGNRVVRISSDWFSHIAHADVVDLANVEDPEIGANLDLAALLNENPESCEYHNNAPFAEAPLFAFGSHLAIPVVHPVTQDDEEYFVTNLIVLDVSGAAPTLAATLELDFEPINTGLGSGIVQVGDSLVFQRPGDNVNENEAGNMQDIILHVVNMANPAAPELLANSLTRPLAAGTTGLHVSDNQLVSGYFAFDNDDVNYFLDRTDVTDPTNPVSFDLISFPGLLLGPLGSEYLVYNTTWRFETGRTEDDCEGDDGEFDEIQNVCWFPARSLYRVGINEDATTTTNGTAELSNESNISAVLLGNERYFLTARDDDGDDQVIVIGTDGTGLATSTVDLGWQGTAISPVIHDEKMYFLNSGSLNLINAENAGAASRSQVASIGEGAVHLTITGNIAIISRGDSGVTTVNLQ